MTLRKSLVSPIQQKKRTISKFCRKKKKVYGKIQPLMFSATLDRWTPNIYIRICLIWVNKTERDHREKWQQIKLWQWREAFFLFSFWVEIIYIFLIEAIMFENLKSHRKHGLLRDFFFSRICSTSFFTKILFS